MNLEFYDILVLVGIPSISAFMFQIFYNAFSGRIRKNKKAFLIEKEETRTIKKALQALLRDRLREHYADYTERGVIDISDKENFNNMYQIYHILGENGVMDTMYETVMELPITPKAKRNSNRTLNNKNSIDSIDN